MKRYMVKIPDSFEIIERPTGAFVYYTDVRSEIKRLEAQVEKADELVTKTKEYFEYMHSGEADIEGALIYEASVDAAIAAYQGE